MTNSLRVRDQNYTSTDERRHSRGTMFDDFERLLDTFWSPRADYLSFSSAVTVEENDEAYTMSVDVPGVRKDALEIELLENRLKLTGERRGQKFERSFVLPRNVDLSRIEAHQEDGVLQILLPKLEQAKARKIQIGRGVGSSKDVN